MSWRYPAVEVATAVLLSIVWYFGPPEQRVAFVGFAGILIAMSVIDIEHYYLPDVLQLTAVGWWGLAAFVWPVERWQNNLYGAAAGFGIMYVIYALSRGGMGFGDVKLAGVMGLYLGFGYLWLALFIGFVAGAVTGVLLILAKKKNRKSILPFGPFLALGTYVTMVYGVNIINWYFAFILAR